jgi:Protein of unknown function (DUF1493)
MPTLDEMVLFVREQTGFRGPLTEATSLQSDIGVYGDDMHELIAAYAERFAVDLSGYIWYFHTGDEGWPNIGGMFFPPPNSRVREIPITVGMLYDFAQHGRWAVEYPDHEPPGPRWDIRINQMIAVGLICVVAAMTVRGCVR